MNIVSSLRALLGLGSRKPKPGGAFGGKHKRRKKRFIGDKRQAQLAIWRRARGV